MPRYRLTIEYDGTPFSGWQRQDNGPSVQQAVETAGEGLSGGKSPVYAAGRTDAGVHALAMTAHIDLPKAFPADTVRDGLNAHLRPQPVVILGATSVTEDFHARFSCRKRHYLYRVLNRRPPSALDRHHVWHVGQPLNVSNMQQAAASLIGKHDFTTYRSAHCQSPDPVKTLDQCDIRTHAEEVRFSLSAPSFLHNQVRSIVGTLVQVGLGRWAPDDVADALAARDRSRCGPVAPPDGLYFVQADYDEAASRP